MSKHTMNEPIQRIPRTPRVKFTLLPQGLEIAIPSRAELAKWPARAAYFFLLTVLTLMGLGFIFMSFTIFWSEGLLIFGLICLIGCGWAERQALFDFFGKERMLMEQKTMHIDTMLFGRVRKRRSYMMDKITNVRHDPGERHLFFDYKGQTVKCGRGIDNEGIDGAEARILATRLTEILTFRCHLVTQIRFGAFTHALKHPNIILDNPDVSELSFPFVHLKRVDIETATYDFHQLERFLTYAINILGQAYLKSTVDVHIYGDQNALHPNLRNTLTNLCKSIIAHE